ncbi:MAG: ankyrin repeat domain-containing protein, partial [Gemmatimonadaceae bacterium]
SGEVGRARGLLQRHAALREKINDPAPELSFGGRPIGAVVNTKDREMIDLFLEFGADINARSDWWAGSFGVLDGVDPDFAPFLISRGARVDVHAAAHLGMLDKLRELVAADPNVVHARGGDGQMPLHFAKSVAITDFLLEHGADIDALDVDHEGTPAQWMIRDRTELARHLVRHGARTDILMAVALGDVELVRKFLDDDPASIHTSVSPKYFPMRDPRAGGHIYIWTLGKNKSAHIVARDFAREHVYKLLMERSPDEVKFAQACALGDEHVVRALLTRDPNLARRLSADERRKLVDAAEDENTAAVRFMLEAGWPLEARGDENATALHWAAWLGNAEMVRDLVKHGAPLEVRGDTFNLTPLGWALHGSTNSWRCKTGDYAGVVQTLLAAGAVAPPDSDHASESVRAVLESHAAVDRKAHGGSA